MVVWCALLLTSGNEWGLTTAESLGSGSGVMTQWKQVVPAGRASDPDSGGYGREGRTRPWGWSSFIRLSYRVL